VTLSSALSKYLTVGVLGGVALGVFLHFSKSEKKS
jgi:hypothetical protein